MLFLVTPLWPGAAEVSPGNRCSLLQGRAQLKAMPAGPDILSLRSLQGGHVIRRLSHPFSAQNQVKSRKKGQYVRRCPLFRPQSSEEQKKPRPQPPTPEYSPKHLKKDPGHLPPQKRLVTLLRFSLIFRSRVYSIERGYSTGGPRSKSGPSEC